MPSNPISASAAARGPAQVLVDRALHDAEQSVALARHERLARPCGPAHRQLHREARDLVRRRKGRALVERHRDGGVEQVLDVHGDRGGQSVPGAVEVGSERDAVCVHLPQPGQRHDLEAARIGQDRPRPVHHPVQAAETRDTLGTRAQHQVIGVAEHDPGAGRAHRVGGHRLDGAGGADRHEHRGRHLAMRGQQRAGAGLAAPRILTPGEGHARSSSEASP